MVTSTNYIKSENADDLPDFSDPEDFVDEIEDNGISRRLIPKSKN